MSDILRAIAYRALVAVRRTVELRFGLTVIVHDGDDFELVTTLRSADEVIALITHAPAAPARDPVVTRDPLATESSIVCKQCGSRSYSPDDMRHCYCGRCCKFHTTLADFTIVLPG